ncbi:hypothetical protein VTI28DRAFT_7043 [Corynascus sepedonium]
MNLELPSRKTARQFSQERQSGLLTALNNTVIKDIRDAGGLHTIRRKVGLVTVNSEVPGCSWTTRWS